MSRAGLSAIFASLMIAGCARVTPPAASSVDAERGHIAIADLQRGRAVLVTKCGNCHRAPMPNDHTATEWPGKLDEMSERAGLDLEQRRVLQQYLVTMASR